MKQILVFSTFMLFSFCSIAQLNSNASYIKKNYSSEYDKTLKKHSLEKWNTDYEMVVYMINNQADALVELIKEFESKNTNIAIRAIQKWSYTGYKSSNVEQIKKIETFGLEQLISIHCDWEMVKYEYDNQLKAKNSF